VALSDEQNAMLRLLASGEQGYADIAALLGQSEDEVRAKVVGALAQLQAEGKPAPNVPPPIPGGAKPAAEVTPPEPEPVEEAPPESDAPAEPVVADAVAPKPPAADPGTPKASAPKPAPAPRAAAPASPPPPSGPPSGGRTITLPSGRNAWLLGGGILVAIVVIVAVILIASGGGGDSSSTSSTEATTAAEGGKGEGGKAEEAAGGSKEATQAELTAVDGSEAAGLATFGRVKNKLALQVEATGLKPTTEGTDSYTIWLAQSPQKMLPLASTAVKGSGKAAGDIAAEFEVPVEILGYLAKGTFDQLAITRTDDKELAAAIAAATKEKKAPAYSGSEVLRGTIKGPIVGLAKREEEERSE
jgi:outer membrane biosynthesis protein TonB